MPKPFHQLSLDEFIDLLAHFPFQRRIDAVHMHHTWRPNHSQYKGLASIEAMWWFHTQQQKWSDIAQHITIAPDGAIWTGRDWNRPPASASGHNGNSLSGPFMFEMIGDFDVGKDRFEGRQREAALQVIARVQTQFSLPVESLRFHNEMSTKSCPGTSLQRSEIIDAVRQIRTTLEASRAAPRARADGMPFGEDALAVRGKTEDILRSMTNRNGVGAVDSLAAELPEATMSEVELSVASGPESFTEPALSGRRDSSRDTDLTPELLNMLRPHVINLTQGKFSSDGLFSTTQGDVDAIFGEHLEGALAKAGGKLRIMFYAHGGLVAEKDGLQIAAKHVSWWKKNNIYPLYFIWETGLFETIGQLLFGSRQRMRDLGTRDLQDYTTDPLIEATVRTLGGVHIWSGMKRSAELSVADDGGARYVVRKLKAFCDAHPNQIELHAVGHSAGSIFLSHFLPAALDLQVPVFDSLHLLAPAIRVDEFHKRLTAHVGGGVRTLNIFTMSKDWEKDDNCAGIYGKSLLYLIYYALEPERKTPILGLEESLRADPSLQKLFGLSGHPQENGEVIWAKTKVKSGRNASTSTSHGGFDDDPPTMNSVVRRILHVGDMDPIVDFAEEVKGTRTLTAWRVPPVWITPVTTPPLVGDELPLSVSSRFPAWTTFTSPAPTAWTNGLKRGAGHRRALCIGINRYPSAPLSGCVADAHAWSQTLVQLGFEAPILLCDEQATRSMILDAMKNLIASSAPGDVVVLQYAGHGTQLPDLDGDEADGDTPGQDEALCPIDYESGAFVIDDDIAEIFRGIPSGVNVTCFFDCCHSGTNTRLAVGASAQLGTIRDQRPRFIAATEDMKKAHDLFRQRLGSVRAVTTGGGQESMRQVVFSACRSSEVAWESGGHGEFTVQATALLRLGIDGISHEEFQRRVTAAFGASPRQHPELDCASEARVYGLLQPFINPAGAVVSAVMPPSPGTGVNGDTVSHLIALTQQLQLLVQGLRS
ncbi:MAG: caspase family protein [Candidatus Binatia bacterium]